MYPLNYMTVDIHCKGCVSMTQGFIDNLWLCTTMRARLAIVCRSNYRRHLPFGHTLCSGNGNSSGLVYNIPRVIAMASYQDDKTGIKQGRIQSHQALKYAWAFLVVTAQLPSQQDCVPGFPVLQRISCFETEPDDVSGGVRLSPLDKRTFVLI